MGAFAGSSALLCKTKTNRLRVVTLTINNTCNLNCPHCYLQYDAPNKVLASDIVEAISKCSALHVSVVGMEPLVNRKSADDLERIITAAHASGKSTSFITNGINTHFLSHKTATAVDWVDVSIDGTSKSYGDFRGARWEKLLKGLDILRLKGVSDIRLLQTVNANNVEALSDMATLTVQLGASTTIFSPFCATSHQGVQADDLAISAQEFSTACQHSKNHLKNAWVVLDSAWLPKEIAGDEYLREMRAAFADRIIFFEDDPTDYGMIRLTFEGQLMTAREAMHTDRYSETGTSLSGVSINQYFNKRCSRLEENEITA